MANMSTPCHCRSLMTPDAACPWHGQRPCKGGCGEMVGEGGLSQYVSSVGHLTPPEDAGTPYYTCQRLTTESPSDDDNVSQRQL